MIIKYGLINNNIDVTNICLSQLTNNNIITIPSCDHNRAKYFTDPMDRVLKKIIIIINEIISEYEDFYIIKINLLDNTITTINDYTNIQSPNNYINFKLSNIHNSLKFKYGSLEEELPEQKMAIRYLTGKEKVLEIGGNIGRNSLVIASILENNSNFVSLECDSNIANQLE